MSLGWWVGQQFPTTDDNQQQKWNTTLTQQSSIAGNTASGSGKLESGPIIVRLGRPLTLYSYDLKPRPKLT